MQRGRERRAFDEVIKAGWDADVIKHSGYGRNMTPFLDHFPLDQFHFIDADSLRNQPAFVMRSVFRFLGVSEIDVEPVWANPTRLASSRTLRQLFAAGQRTGLGRRLPPPIRRKVRQGMHRVYELAPTGDRMSLSPAQHNQLAALFRPDAELFSSATGVDISHWRTLQVGVRSGVTE